MSDPEDELAPEESHAGLPTEDAAALLRWRLVLGRGAEDVAPEFRLSALAAWSEALEIDGARTGELDLALEFVYGEGGGGSRPYIPKWLGLVREFFAEDVVAFVQNDAIERRGLTQLLFEPETLPLLEKNVELVTTLMSAKGLVPDRAKDMAREIVAEVVNDLRHALETEVRTAIYGAARRGSTSPLEIARNIDWKRTIHENLHGWDRQRRRLVPERFYFRANERKHHEWDVVLLVDQSGSMAASVVYASVMAAIFASLDVLRTRLVVFDTEVVDLTPILVDPVEVLFTAQLGGGTDINRAVAYARAECIERPDKTILLLVTDLHEAGDRQQLVARMRELVDARVRVMVLLALTDGGTPSYDHPLAATLTELGVPCFGCTPKLLTQVMERVMQQQDVTRIIAEAQGRARRA